MENYLKLQKIIDESDNIVFFGGAGVSTDSGLKDFRSKDGIYNKKYKYSLEEMLSAPMFYKCPEEFYQFYKENFNCLEALPNATHKYLKKLEDKGKLKGIITQNIDGLHTKAGSKNVYEIHGTIYKNYCLNCHTFYDANYIFNSKDIPYCEKCGEIIKPDVVLYGEMLPSIFNDALKLIERAETLIVAGTSLLVEPAGSMIKLFHGKNLIIINNDPTPYDEKANLVIHDNISNLFKKLQ